MHVVHCNALFEVLGCNLIITNFEVCQAQVVLELWVIVVDALSIFKGCDRSHVLTLLINGDTVEEIRSPSRCIVLALLKVCSGVDCQCLPVILVNSVPTIRLKHLFLLEIELSLFTLVTLIVVQLKLICSPLSL